MSEDILNLTRDEMQVRHKKEKRLLLAQSNCDRM